VFSFAVQLMLMTFRWTTINKYYLFSFLKDFGFFSAVLIPFYTEWGGISLLQVQLIQSWFLFWLFVMEIPTGVIADKFGRKHSMTVGAALVAVAVIVYSLVPNIAVFLLAEFLFATALALISGADSALLYDSLKETNQEDQSKCIFGRANSIRLLGMMLAAPIGSLIAAQFGLQAPMLLSALPFLLAAGIAWSITEPTIRPATSQSPHYLEILTKGFSYIRENRMFKILLLNGTLVSVATYFVVWLYQPALTNIGIPLIYFGWIHALLIIFEIFVSSNFVRIEKLLGSSQRYLTFTAVVTSMAFLLVAMSPNLLTMLLFLIFAGGFGLTRLEYVTVIMNKTIPSAQRSTVLSSVSMFRRFVIFVVNPVVGLLATQSLSLAFAAIALLPLATLLLPKVTRAESAKTTQ